MPKGYPGRVLVHGAVGYTGHRCRCTICVTEWRAYKRAYYHANKDSSRRYELRVKYGITLEEYDRMLRAQKFRCAICRRKRKVFRLGVDHDHTTLVVRGLLCYPCNRALGWFEKYRTTADEYLARAHGKVE